MPNAADNDNNGKSAQDGPMSIYLFASETNETIAPGKALPHRMARDQIEKAIANSGFQLWI